MEANRNDHRATRITGNGQEMKGELAMSPDVAVVVYRRLAAAILARAVLDARNGNGHAAEARLWLVCDPLAGFLFDGLGYDRGKVRRWVQNLEPIQQPALL
jgi:hypothetical protein